MAYYDLGTYSRKVTTTSDEAQLWFDRGLIWTYGYHHEEAIVCFQKAIAADPDCAMAHWGIAYAIGPNYNKPWETFEEEEKPDCLELAGTAISKAKALKDRLSPFERDLIEAIDKRYPEDPAIEEFAPWNDAFADAMRGVYEAHKGDMDVSCLFAEAIMNRTPWQLWDLPSGKPADGADTLEAIAVLETAFDTIPVPGSIPVFCTCTST